MMTTNQPTNTIPDANTAPTHPPTEETAQERRKRLSAEKKAQEKEKMRAELRAEMEAEKAELRAELEAEMKAELDKAKAEIQKLKDEKPVKRAREPKPPTYWEGQVETEDGEWRFESKETAKLYGKSLKGEEKDDFMMEWDEPFAEKKEKKSIKNREYDARELPANETATRCAANLWNNGNGCRCRRNGNKTSINWKGEEVYLCDQHYNNIKENVDKWKLWEEVCGNCPKNGWWDDEDWKSKMKKAEKGGKKDNWSNPRGKKD